MRVVRCPRSRKSLDSCSFAEQLHQKTDNGGRTYVPFSVFVEFFMQRIVGYAVARRIIIVCSVCCADSRRDVFGLEDWRG